MIHIRLALDETGADKRLYEFLETRANGGRLAKVVKIGLYELMTFEKIASCIQTDHAANSQETSRISGSNEKQVEVTKRINFEALDDMP